MASKNEYTAWRITYQSAEAAAYAAFEENCDLRDSLRAIESDRGELLDLLSRMFDAYEDGPECYEDPEDESGYIGKGLRLDDETFHRIVAILNKHRPRK